MKKILAIVVVAAAVAWYFLNTPSDPRYFSTQEGEFNVLILNGSSMIHGKAKLHYGGTIQMNGQEYHKFATIFDAHLGIPSEYVLTRLAADGIYSRVMDNQKNAPEYPVLSFPLRRGHHWDDHLRGYWLHNRIYEVDSCVTPARTYERCVHVMSTGTLGKLRETRTTVYAPDVGLVKLSYGDKTRRVEMTRG